MKNKELKSNELLKTFIIIALLLCIFLIIFNNPSMTGFAINDYHGQNIQKLKLTSMCSDNPDVFRVWRVWNKNDLDIDFNWDVYKAGQNGLGIAVADGYTYFNTTTVDGANTVRIFVNESQHDTKASGGAQCEPEPEPCIENWTCSEWEECSAGNSTRVCIDNNYCNTYANIPLLLQECSEPEPCIENWICGEWVDCVNNSRIRQCADANECDTFADMPELSQFCEENLTDINLTEPEQNLTEPEQNLTSEENLTEEVPVAQETVTVTESSSSGGGGGGSGGGKFIIIQKNITTDNLNQNEFINQSEQLELESTLEQGIENNPSTIDSFVTFIGNIIGAPFSKTKLILEEENKIYLIIFIILLILFLFVLRKILRLKRKIILKRDKSLLIKN